MPGRADLAIYQGDDFAAVVKVLQSDNQPADITGFTANAQIRRAVADVDPAIVETIAATVASPNVFLALTHTQTAGLAGRYVWDLQIVSGSGAITTLLVGNVVVSAEVTRVAVVIPALTITTAALANGTVGVAYSQLLAATGGSGGNTWSVSVGALPAGLSLNASSGLINGTPTWAGATTNFTVQAADSSGATASKALNITVSAARSWYVSNAGSDSATGLDASHSWAHAPGMTGATGVAASTLLSPGDSVLLNRGDSWLSTTLTVPAGGASGAPITLGAYGSGARPVISAIGDNPVITANAANRGYWTIDNLDLRASGAIGGIGQPATIYHNYWSSGDPLPVPGWIIQNCVSSGSFFLSGPDTVVRSNVVDGASNANPPWAGITIRGPLNVNALVELNTVSHFTDRGIWIMNGAPSPIVRYNTVHDILGGSDNSGTGIDIDGFNQVVPNAQVYGNLIYNCAGIGVQLENGQGAKVSYNLIHDCVEFGGIAVINYAAYQTQPTNLEISYNVIYNCTIGIPIWESQTLLIVGNTIATGLGVNSKGLSLESVDTNISNITFENNIIAGVWTHPVQVRGPKAIWTAFDYNDIVPNGTQVVFETNGSVSKTLAQLQSGGLMTHGITGNPSFVSPGSNFSLLTGSPAIATGVNLGSFYNQGLKPSTVWPNQIDLDTQTSGQWNMGAYVGAGTPPALSVTTTSLPNGVVGVAYSQTLTSIGGSGGNNWTVSVGSLPAGLTLNASSGLISGTPSAAGTTNFTVRVTDSSSAAATKVLTIIVSAISFDFTTGSLPGAITFTRASTGTYTNNAGALASAAINTARLNYIGGVSHLLIEPAATNLLLQSNNFGTSWFPGNGATITGAQFVSPDGTNNGWSVTSGASIPGFGSVAQSFTFSNIAYKLSVWLKSINGTPPVNLTLNNLNSSVTPTATIARFTISLTPNAGAGNVMFLLNVGVSTAIEGVFGAQLETGPAATSYIPTTTGSATRAADSATFTIPAGVTQLIYTFDDNSTQTVAAAPGSYTIPTNLSRPNIKLIQSS